MGFYLQLALIGALGILAVIGGTAAVNDAATARASIQSSINTVTPQVTALTSEVTMAQAALTTASTSQATVTAQLAKICPAINGVATAPNGADTKARIDNIVAALNANKCP